ncbi:MAG: aminotransferase class III-fold pyridoxal phosphate-dependent enzyme [Chloroflexota bacterium]|nr:aminotransferase class III-fold pyridoxal phosphate-dependent enzyme [Chloroflexota bacterium]
MPDILVTGVRRASRSLVDDVRGLGLLLDVELVRDRATGERAVEETEAVMYAALDRGLNVKTTMGNVVNLSPPLVISREEMDAAMGILDLALGAVEMEFGHAP